MGIAVYFLKDDEGASDAQAAPGFSHFSLQSNNDLQQNNVSVAADYTLTINGRVLHRIDPFSLVSSSGATFEPPDKYPETDNLDWLLGQMDRIKNFFSDKNFYIVYAGTSEERTLMLGSGCTIKSLSFSTQDYLNHQFDYTAEISIPVTGGETNPGPTKYLSTTQEHYIKSIDENISISKNNLHDFDFGDYKLNSDDSNQYVGPDYTIIRTLSASAKTPGATGSLFYAKNAVWDLYDNSLEWKDITKNLAIADTSISQSMDEIAGSYTLTSTITAYTGVSWTENKSYVNRYDVNITYSQELKRTVSINGTMKATKTEPDKLKELNYLPDRKDGEEEGKKYYLTNVASDTLGEGLTGDDGEGDGRFKIIKDLYYDEIAQYFHGTAAMYAYNNSFAEDHEELEREGYHTLLEKNRERTVLENWSGNIPSDNKDNPLKYYLNPIPIDYTVTFNLPEQSIDYSVTFDNRTLPTVEGARRESIEYEDTYAQNLYVNHEIFHGAPVLQDLNTYGSNTRTVTYSANFPRTKIDLLELKLKDEPYKKVKNIVDSFDPSWIFGTTEYKEYLTKFEENLDRKGKYTMTKSWEW